MAETRSRGIDAVAFLSNDHRATEELFKMLESQGTDRATVIDRLADELTVHAEIEEEILYPAIRKEVPGGRRLASHAEEEHQEVSKMLRRLKRLDPNSREADDLLQELHQSVQQHVAEEQGPDGLFAQLRQAVDDNRLREMGTELSEAKLSRRLPDEEESSDTHPPPQNTPGGRMFWASWRPPKG